MRDEMRLRIGRLPQSQQNEPVYQRKDFWRAFFA
jgi:hypothetical protein